MIKTHEKSRMALLSLDQIRDTSDIVLQAEKTGSTFESTGRTAYLCEAVKSYDYAGGETASRISDELIRVNAESRKLRNKIERLERDLKKRKAEDGHE